MNNRRDVYKTAAVLLKVLFTRCPDWHHLHPYSLNGRVDWLGRVFLTDVEDQDLGSTCQIETEEEYEIRNS